MSPRCNQHVFSPQPDCAVCLYFAKKREKQRSLANARKTPFIVQGIDLNAQMRAMWRLPAFRSNDAGPWPPTLYISWGVRGARGVASVTNNRIRLRMSLDTPLPYALELLLHELVHISLPAREGHSERFILRLVRAAAEMWGIAISAPLATPRGRHKCTAYAVDARLVQALKAKFAGEPEAAPRPVLVLPPPPIDLTAKRERMVRDRAEHAKNMLATHETKLKREQRLVSKWRRTVRYYRIRELTAAKRSEP
jgi:hypothetical protein